MARSTKRTKDNQPHRETDLHAPIHAYLERQGYTVQAEVSDCDLVARKDEDLIVIEFKRRMSINLLVQATDRQRITESVYVALPGPLELSRGSRWNGIRRLLRSLELGLILVWILPENSVETGIHIHPLTDRADIFQGWVFLPGQNSQGNHQ